GRMGVFWSDLSSLSIGKLNSWIGEAVPPYWWFEYQCVPSAGNRDAFRWVMVPLWAFLLPCAGLTLWLWRRDQRHVQPGHCRCGYDLTGNVSGRCPECGAACDRVT